MSVFKAGLFTGKVAIVTGRKVCPCCCRRSAAAAFRRPAVADFSRPAVAGVPLLQVSLLLQDTILY